MSYFLNELEETVRDLFHDYATKKLMPLRRELDEKGEFPIELIKEMGKLDFFRVMVPEKYGGMSDNVCILSALAVEELSRGESGVGLTFAASDICTTGIIHFGNEEQKQKYLPGIGSGDILTAFALTEPEAGSDPGAQKTRAVKKGNKYVINGVKQFITNAGYADVYLVFTATDPEYKHRGVTGFLIDKDTPGIRAGRKEDKMGQRSSITTELILEDCEVPEENILGGYNKGFYVALGIFDRSRICIAAQALGIAQAAFEVALKYSKDRKQFGRSIQDFQAIEFMLADMATQIEASRLMVYHAARNADRGSKHMSKYTSMAKMFASDACVKVTSDAVQILGGYGYMKEYPTEKLYRDAKVIQIYEGSNQIQRIVIARSLKKEQKD